jgi:hypothetical protein
MGEIMKKKITDKVMRANQENATHSTGPTTTAGKLTVNRNAVRHGLLCRTLRFRNDKERESFRMVCAELMIDMTPANAVERMLLEQLAACWFRLSRAQRTRLMEAFDLHVKACNAWAQANGIAPEDASQFVMRAGQAEGQAAATAVPAGYRVVGFTPTQTILLPEEVTPEHIRTAEQMVAKRVARNAAEHRKPQ